MPRPGPTERLAALERRLERLEAVGTARPPPDVAALLNACSIRELRTLEAITEGAPDQIAPPTDPVVAAILERALARIAAGAAPPDG